MVASIEPLAREPVLRPQTLVVAYWLVMVLLAAFFLRMACGLCRTNLPSWRRAFMSVIFVTLLAYLAYDYVGYLIMRSMENVFVTVPPWYGYNFWFREPLNFKLYVLSYAGFLQYLPFVIGLCVAGFLQVLALDAQVTFRFGLLIVLLEAAATVVAGYFVSLFLGLAIYPPGGVASRATPPGPPAGQTPGRPPQGPPGAGGGQQSGGGSDSFELLTPELKDAVARSHDYFKDAAKNLRAYGDSHLEELKQELAPFTRFLPPPIRKFLDEGGWWIVLGVLAFITLLWLNSIVRRVRRGLSRSHKKRKKRRMKSVPVRLKEDLSQVGPAYTEEGDARVLVKGLPCRLRLMILSLGNRNAGELSEDMADRVLDWIKPGLAAAAAADYPRVRVWPPFYAGGFANAFASNVAIPEPKGTRSPWVLVTGQVKLGTSLINVGLAFYADEENTLRNLTVKGERWLDIVSVQRARAAAGAR